MSFLSSHRIHWGEHDALTGHLLTHLEVHLHDLPLAHADGSPPPAAGARENAEPAAGLEPPDDTHLPDTPGP